MLGPNHWNGGDKINFQELANVFGGGFSCGSAAKESACNVGDLGLIPGLEDPLEKGKATHSSTLAWRIPYSPWGRKESDMTEQLSLSHLEGGRQLRRQPCSPLYHQFC